MITLKEALPRPAETTDAIIDTVQSALSEIRRKGWKGIVALSKHFDNFEGPFRIPAEALREAENALPSLLKEAIRQAATNIRIFHQCQRELLRDANWEVAPGVNAGLRFVPVKSAAVYIPGGRYPLPSTALMGVIPAQVAGVKRIVAFSPPRGGLGIDPVVLGTLGFLGIQEVWALGGVQAIAAAALGFDPVSRVDMVVGPGNAYVTEAKRQLFGEIGIDGLAGQSEVLIVADGSANPARLAADLLAQAEHDPLAKATLLATDEAVARATLAEVTRLLGTLETAATAREAWEANGGIFVCTLDEAVAEANAAAPEHLELALANAANLLPRFTAYGAAFLGSSSAEAFGDYVAGTNHILPTEGKARFAGGVWTGTFLRPLTHLQLSPEGAASLSGAGAALADAEGLAAHALALRLRGKNA